MRSFCLFLISVFWFSVLPVVATAHNSSVSGTHLLDYHSDTISRVLAPGFSWNNLGGTAITFPVGKTSQIDDMNCVSSAALNLDVRDSYAYDISEDVTLSFHLDARDITQNIFLHYDRVGGPATLQVKDQEEGEFRQLELKLPSARFSNRGDHGTDIMINSAALPPEQLQSFTICDPTVTRSYTSKQPERGRISLRFIDEQKQDTTVRVGLYRETTGRLPVPSVDAVSIRKFDDRTKTFLLQRNVHWPHSNRFIFYVDGRYEASVPAGNYRLIATKGIEYRYIDTAIEVKPGETTSRNLQLKRFTNMTEQGWYSGDVHIHNIRNDPAINKDLIAQTSAEDLHVANILRMGNVGAWYFPQLAWGRDGRYSRGGHTIVPGQEDPRTLTLGHTIHLNLTAPVRFADDYLNYQRVFNAVQEQGGISGFAHAAGGLPGTVEGMIMQAVFGLLDFGEIMQGSQIGTDVWFQFLNLGLRFSPAAGTDYPYINHPGAERSYVKTNAPDVDKWYEGLAQGATFVTNGPLIDFSINNAPIGSDVAVGSGETLKISARATINPDLGELESLEVISMGDVVAKGTEKNGSISLDKNITATNSGWAVVKSTAAGDTPISAVTAPIFVIVDGNERTWKREAVPAIVDQLVGAVEAVKQRDPATVFDSEAWHSMPVWQRDFVRQLKNAEPRLTETQQRLLELKEDSTKD